MSHKDHWLSRALRMFVGGLTIAAVACSTCAQTIQPWAPGFEEVLRTSVDERFITHLQQYIHLSEPQVVAARRMVAEHQQRFAEFVEASKPEKDRHEATVRPLEVESLDRLNAELERERALARMADSQHELDKRAIEGLTTILSKEQLERWPLVVQAWTRTRWLGADYVFVEERPDVVAIVESQAARQDRIIPSEAVAVMNTYSAEMHQALGELSKHMIQFCRHFYRSNHWENDGKRFWMAPPATAQERAAAERWKKEKLRRHERIEALNKSALVNVCAVLPIDFARQVKDEYFQAAAVPDLIDPARMVAHATLQRAMILDTLTAEQKDSIAAIISQYDAQRDAADRAVLSAGSKCAFAGFDGSDADARNALQEKLDTAVAARYALENQIIESLLVLLDQQQRQALSKPRPAASSPAQRSSSAPAAASNGRRKSRAAYTPPRLTRCRSANECGSSQPNRRFRFGDVFFSARHRDGGGQVWVSTNGDRGRGLERDARLALCGPR